MTIFGCIRWVRHHKLIELPTNCTVDTADLHQFPPRCDFVAASRSGRGLYIGAGKNLEPSSFFTGLIDDVRIYDQAIEP